MNPVAWSFNSGGPLTEVERVEVQMLLRKVANEIDQAYLTMDAFELDVSIVPKPPIDPPSGPASPGSRRAPDPRSRDSA